MLLPTADMASAHLSLSDIILSKHPSVNLSLSLKCENLRPESEEQPVCDTYRSVRVLTERSVCKQRPLVLTQTNVWVELQ